MGFALPEKSDFAGFSLPEIVGFDCLDLREESGFAGFFFCDTLGFFDLVLSWKLGLSGFREMGGFPNRFSERDSLYRSF